jgi:two-component system, oxyanion-binding sensor
MYKASQWCGVPANHAEAAAIMAAPAYLNQPSELLLRGLSGRIEATRGEPMRVDGLYVPHAQSATFPWISHALWFYSQMVRWHDIPHSEELARRAAACYRPDLYRSAIAPFGASLPTSDRRTLGPDTFFDGKVFDPAQLDSYIADQAY